MREKVLAMVSPMSAARIAGIARCAHEQGWHLMIQDRLGYHPLAWNGDGVIAALRSDPVSVDAVRRLMKRGIPVVDLTISRPDIKVPRVMSDHTAIGRLAAEHFAERNYRNIVWFSTGWGKVQELRYLGLTERAPAARWVAEEELPKTRRNDWNTFLRWLAAKLKAAPKPLAALTYDESDAARLLDVAERTGLSVPEELAILSIGNDPLICENQSVTLSSIDQNLERGGYEAARLLGRLMAGERRCPRMTLIPPKGLVLRRSTDAIAVANPVLRHAMEFISGNLARPIGASEIAEAIGITRSILDKRFAVEIGRPAHAEILRQRLARTKALLQDGDKSITQIAALTGFCTPSHLSNTFKAATGLSPRAWRASNQPPTGI